ncbi:MAG: hypothetical protein P8Y00_09365, partial [Deltaproteobacteria bacterium]
STIRACFSRYFFFTIRTFHLFSSSLKCILAASAFFNNAPVGYFPTIMNDHAIAQRNQFSRLS